MNKKELKKALKPLIKECIKELIFEDGTLSTIISEVVKGTHSQQVVAAQVQAPAMSTQALQQHRNRKEKQLSENHKKMIESIGRTAYNGVNLFEGTTPLSNTRSSTSPHGSKPLDGIDPRDPGVDISTFGTSGLWKKLAGN